MVKNSKSDSAKVTQVHHPYFMGHLVIPQGPTPLGLHIACIQAMTMGTLSPPRSQQIVCGILACASTAQSSAPC